MNKRLLCLLSLVLSGFKFVASAAVITVTTTNSVDPGTGVSLLQALTQAHSGDEIRFNIPGPNPHYLLTPPDGYPFITNSNVIVNGYSQPGSSPNSSPILAANVAKIGIVLDSRAGGRTLMANLAKSPNDDPGYDPQGDAAVLAVVDAQNFQLRGVSFLGVPNVGPNNESTLSFVSFARGASGQISGCWFGVDPDGTTVSGAGNGVTGLRYQAKDETGAVTNTLLINGLILGVPGSAETAVQEFNVFVGMPEVPILIEGDDTRISGNFITVLPDGLHDFDVALNPDLQGQFRGAIEIGRGGNNTLIGTDGDGVNDENERNIFGGMIPTALGGYDHLIEFYGQNPGTNIVIAGNYFGMGVDGKTRFTNGVPILNASGTGAQYRIGSNLDNLSDPSEGNLIANNYPSSLFPASGFQPLPDSLNFLSQLTASTAVSLRGNSLIDNFPFPASPLRGSSSFLNDYYAQALADPSSNVSPVLATNSTLSVLQGTVPLTDTSIYPATAVDIYVADPEGMTNGIAAGIPQLPQGFVQGLKYLGSFVENSAADQDKQAGSFRFDISRFKLTPGTQITVTANYLAPTGVSDLIQFTGISRTDTGIAMTWVGNASLQAADNVLGPWADVGSLGNSFESTSLENAQFYRLLGTGDNSESSAPALTSPFSNIVSLPQ